MKYIFVVGGVMSGVGKGVASASIAKILQSRGYEVTSVKIDPYVNVDAGTMNPTEHGEVFVLDDGTECDQDMGNYERFLSRSLSGLNYMTTGSIYRSVINKERALFYKGKCVEVVPHIPLEVIEKINRAAEKSKAEIVIVEIGGTVGEYQNILFLEAIRMLEVKNPKDVLLALVSHLPYLNQDGELKTKPTQYAVRTLNSAGLHPDIIIARAFVPLDKKRKEKISFNSSIEEEDVISAPDVSSIYEIPLNFEKEKISDRLLAKLSLSPKGKNLTDFKKLNQAIKTAGQTVKIGIVGKYFGTGGFTLTDSYLSVIEAVRHAAAALHLKPSIDWLDAERPGSLGKYDGLIVPGGFGERGVAGKIKTISYAREHKIPLLGLCYGMQLMVVEFARNKAGLKKAHTTEADPGTPSPVIDLLPEQKEKMKKSDFGATMRLGAQPAAVKKGTLAHGAYRAESISERHRHRYEVNPDYVPALEKAGLVFSATSPNRRLMEIAELPRSKHPFFLGTQFHPEFKSWPLKAHPLFVSFLKAAAKK